MTAEILSTGDEIRTGTLVDTNTAYIAEKLEETGIEVTRHLSVGDDIQILVSVLLEISARSDIAVVTGGLGPTTDDLTAEAAAKAAGKKLALNESALSDIRALFEKSGRPMSPSNEKQAMFPEGAECLKNPLGTAPGFSIKIGKCTFFFVPGVPFEMKRMLADHVIPAVQKMQGKDKFLNITRTIRTFGLGESIVGERVAGITKEFGEIKLGLRASFPETHVKLYIRGNDENKMRAVLDNAVKWAVEKIGGYIFSIDETPIEEIIGRLLKEKHATLSIAESCTGGLIADIITNVPGSSDYFLFSGITYSNQAKIDILGVKPKTLEKYGAVSEETVHEMAEGVRKITGSNYGLATSGIAGPDGGTENKPVGTVCIGLAGPASTIARKYKPPFRRFNSSYGSRLMNKKWFAMRALEILRRELAGIQEHNES